MRRLATSRSPSACSKPRNNQAAALLDPLGDAENDNGAVVLEGIATAVAHGLEDSHGRSRSRRAFEGVESPADPLPTEIARPCRSSAR